MYFGLTWSWLPAVPWASPSPPPSSSSSISPSPSAMQNLPALFLAQVVRLITLQSHGTGYGFYYWDGTKHRIHFCATGNCICNRRIFYLFFPQLPVLAIAIFGYVVFSSLNIYGVRAAAAFELLITILAVGELLLFAASLFLHSNGNCNAMHFPMGGQVHSRQYLLQSGFFRHRRGGQCSGRNC